MDHARRVVLYALTVEVVGALIGCAPQRALVAINYVLEPSQGLPPGMHAVAILDAHVSDPEDREWSTKARDSIQGLVLEARNRHGADIVVADRRDLGDILNEDDLAAAGVTAQTAGAGAGGKVMDVQGIVKSEIDVKLETHTGKQQTIDGVDWYGFKHAGGGQVHTREIETVSRNITVKTTFKLFDRTTNRDWITYSPDPYTRHDKTEGFFILGSSRTEAELPPRDQIISEAVNEGVRQFVSKFLPCEMRYEVTVESSANKDCQTGVQLLRADEFDAALSHFKAALADDPNDCQAAFAAGVAAEAAGLYDEALGYYRRAYAIRAENRYKRAKERLTEHLPYIRRSGVS